jgi:hypothetical protein
MRITGPGGGVPPPPIDGATPGAAGKAVGGGEAFAARLGEAPVADGPAAGAAPAAPAPGAQGVIDELRAGRITPEQAIDRLVEDTVGRRVGAAAPEAARQRLRAALTELIATDPHLRDLARRMERKLS